MEEVGGAAICFTSTFVYLHGVLRTKLLVTSVFDSTTSSTTITKASNLTYLNVSFRVLKENGWEDVFPSRTSIDAQSVVFECLTYFIIAFLFPSPGAAFIDLLSLLESIR